MGSMAIMIEWPDGTMDVGPTPEAVLEMIAADQWHDYTPEEMRSVLSDRAWAWSGAAIAPDLPLSEFFRKMEEAGICVILRWMPPADPEVV